MSNFIEYLEYLPPLSPMLRLFLGLSVGLFIASIMEAFRLTKYVAKCIHPLVHRAHLGETSAAAFGLALFSPASANALLGEALEEKKISERELIISNLFNSLPSTLVHLPTVFFLIFPVLGFPAVIYVFLSFLAGILRTLATIFLGYTLLVPCTERICLKHTPKQEDTKGWKLALKNALKRFKKRFPRLLFIGIPIYCLIYYAQFFGFFDHAEQFLAQKFNFDFLPPESISIILLYMAAEMQAALAAAATVFTNSSLSQHDIVLALLIGNLLSTPMRAIRHQMPAYVSYFPAKLALKLVIISQSWRALSILLIILAYYQLFIQ